MSDSNLTNSEASSIKLEDFIEAATRGAMKALEAQGQSTDSAGQIEGHTFRWPHVTIGIVWRPPTKDDDPYNQGTNEPS